MQKEDVLASYYLVLRWPISSGATVTRILEKLGDLWNSYKLAGDVLFIDEIHRRII